MSASAIMHSLGTDLRSAYGAWPTTRLSLIQRKTGCEKIQLHCCNLTGLQFYCPTDESGNKNGLTNVLSLADAKRGPQSIKAE